MFRVTKESPEAQLKECYQNGNARRERDTDRARYWIMCRRYGGFCKYWKCKKDRKAVRLHDGNILFRRWA